MSQDLYPLTDSQMVQLVTELQNDPDFAVGFDQYLQTFIGQYTSNFIYHSTNILFITSEMCSNYTKYNSITFTIVDDSSNAEALSDYDTLAYDEGRSMSNKLL